jgi:hypothetical protein
MKDIVFYDTLQLCVSFWLRSLARVGTVYDPNMVSSFSIQIRIGILTCRSFIIIYDSRGTLKPGCNPSAQSSVVNRWRG